MQTMLVTLTRNPSSGIWNKECQQYGGVHEAPPCARHEIQYVDNQVKLRRANSDFK